MSAKPKKKKNQSDKEIIDQVQKQNPSDHPEVNNSTQISDDDEEYEDDGRIHSLSRKYRPYACPKRKIEFPHISTIRGSCDIILLQV